MEASIKIRMKPSDFSGGWVAKMMESGFKVTSGSLPFGRTAYIIKKNGEHIKVAQGMSTALSTVIEKPTPTQLEIIAALRSSDAAFQGAA